MESFNNFKDAIKYLRENSKKRNFTQAFDLIIALRGIDLRKPENRIEEFVILPNPIRENVKVAMFVGKELENIAKKVFDIIKVDELENFDKAKIRRTVKNYDFFVAQANIMANIAKVFGKKLASQKKMPNPKLGTIVGINVSEKELNELKEKLKRTIVIRVKKQPNVQVKVGNEKMKDEEIEENCKKVIEELLKKLPNGKSNIKRIYLKLTMSKPVEVKIFESCKEK